MEVEALSFLADIAWMMIMALILGYAANKLGQPAMLGYLFAGMIIGPFSPSKLINNLEEIEALANVGVSLLLFMVGLEFTPKKLKDIWRPSALSGTFEMVMMLILGTVVGLVLGVVGVRGASRVSDWRFEPAVLAAAVDRDLESQLAIGGEGEIEATRIVTSVRRDRVVRLVLGKVVAADQGSWGIIEQPVDRGG